ncbi:hypothetical protein SSX86_003504 [Deinandra increscens subsp. villosa]|uniref:Uncharacterized protein n=1 Tax=Deinandra increscens subsp. villosa TaxID=3103831 RepID=A0AAP0DLE9_9ASTR
MTSLDRQFEEKASCFKDVLQLEENVCCGKDLVNHISRQSEVNEKVKGQRVSGKEHQLSAILDDVNEGVWPEPKRSSLAWDSAFFTCAGLLDPEELHMLNKGFKKISPTQKDDKRSKVATKFGCTQSNAISCKKMNTCPQNKSRTGAIQNVTAVKGMQDKTRTLQDSKRCRSGGLPKSNAFTTPTTEKFHRLYESSASASSKSSSERKVKPKGMKLVNSPSSVLHFPQLSAIFDDVKEDVQPEPKRSSFLRKSLSWDSDFFTSDGLLDSEELHMLNKGFKKTPITQEDGIRLEVATKFGCSESNAISCKKINTCSQNKSRMGAIQNGAAVKGMQDKTRTLQDSKRCRLSGLSVSNAFRTPTTEKFHRSYESSSIGSSKSSSEHKVKPKGMKLVNSPSSVLHFPQLSAQSEDVKEDGQPEPKGPSFLRESIAWDSAFFSTDGLLDHEELFVLHKGFKKTPLAQKDDKRSKVATKISGSQSNASQDSKTTRSKRTLSGGLPKSNAITIPTTKNIQCSYEPSSTASSQNSSESEVNLKGVKLSSSPSSVLYFPLSSSPTSSDDGWLSESLCSTTITHQSPIPELDFHSKNSKEKKLISENATIKSSSLRMPSPRIGFFDMLGTKNCNINKHRVLNKSKKGAKIRVALLEQIKSIRFWERRKAKMGYTKGLFSVIMRDGEPLVKKLAAVSVFGVLPGAMIASLVYSPPDFIYHKKSSSQQ